MNASSGKFDASNTWSNFSVSIFLRLLKTVCRFAMRGTANINVSIDWENPTSVMVIRTEMPT